MNKIVAVYATCCLFSAGGPLWAADPDANAADTQIVVNYSASPAADATEVGVSRGFQSKVISKEVGEDIRSASVEPGALNGQPYAVYVRWADKTESSFPVFLISAFAKQEIEVDFLRVAVSKDNVVAILQANCNATNPSTQQQAFKIMAACGAVSRWLRANDGSWSDSDLQALNSWFIANRWLYYRKDGAIQLSPYGLEPDLVDALNELMAQVKGGKRASIFKPLDTVKIGETLKDHSEEPVRMASFVPKLIREKRLDEALAINQYALDAYNGLSGGNNAKVIVRITGDVLNNNAKYINALIANNGSGGDI
ncbi:hypothetical protein [Mesorhizobium sp. M0715]|uniref:hypothetical protein n=1 Tax=Mesorhizobium sp. M0715 TaxID=2956990 RepID=UPI00333A6C7C